MLKRIYRVTKEKEFQAIYRRGKFKSTALFSVHYLPNRLDFTRVGIVVTKKISKKAVERNLLKRRVREVAREIQPNIVGHYDIVISIKKPLLEKDFADLKSELVNTFQKAGLLK
jgi:ribonuclease P protein component